VAFRQFGPRSLPLQFWAAVIMSSSNSSSMSDHETLSSSDDSSGSDHETFSPRSHRSGKESQAWNVEASSAWVQSLGTRYTSERLVKLLLPCAGFDAPGFALAALKIPCKVMGAWDMARGPSKLLHSVYPRSVVHTGTAAGDITKVNPRDLPDVEGLVSGTPCPPWSQAGKGGAWGDPRSAPFLAVRDWLTELAGRRRCLRFFVLENVKGIKHKHKGSKQTPLHVMLKLLKASVPAGWRITVVDMDSECVAQSRPRVYIVGHVVVNPRQQLLDNFLQKLPAARLEDVLLMHRVPNQAPEEVLTKKQQANLLQYTKQVKDITRGKKRALATFEVCRDPAKPRAGINTKRVRCLRAAAPKIWLLSYLRNIPGRAGQPGRISRLLHAAEHCLLQGFSPSKLPRSLTDRELKRGMGNAMTVPVIGMILNAVLLTLQGHVSGGNLRSLTRSTSSASSSSDGSSSSSTVSSNQTSSSS